MSTTWFPLFFALLALGAPMAAQEEPDQGGRDAGQQSQDEKAEKIKQLQERLGKGGKVGNEAMDEADAKAKGAAMGATTRGAAGFCRIDASMHPKRLLPGQNGTILLTMVLEGDSVLPASPTLSVKAANNAMQISGWSIRPPQQARIAQAFLGQPAYDNWAVIEVPVTMPTNVQLGSRHFQALDLEFELVSGSKGTPLGRFNERLSVVCEVGVTQDPAVVGGAAAPAPAERPATEPRAEPASVPAAAVPSTTSPPPVPTLAAQGNGGTGAHTVTVGEAPETTSLDTTYGDGTAGSSSFLLVGVGSAAVIGLLALLLARRK